MIQLAPSILLAVATLVSFGLALARGVTARTLTPGELRLGCYFSALSLFSVAGIYSGLDDSWRALYAILLAALALLFLPHRGESKGPRSDALVGPLLLGSSFLFFRLSESQHLLELLFSLEILFLAGGALAFLGAEKKLASEALLKWMLGSAWGATFLWGGAALLYLNLGSFDLSTIKNSVAQLPISSPHAGGLMLALFCFVLGASIKLGAFPLHAPWVDALTAASPAGRAALILFVRAATILVAVKVFGIALSDDKLANSGAGWSPALLAIGGISLLGAGLVASRQSTWPRLRAYLHQAKVGVYLLGIVLELDGSFSFSPLLTLVALEAATSLGLSICEIAWSKDAVIEPDWDFLQLTRATRSSRLLSLSVVVCLLTLVGAPFLWAQSLPLQLSSWRGAFSAVSWLLGLAAPLLVWAILRPLLALISPMRSQRINQAPTSPSASPGLTPLLRVLLSLSVLASLALGVFGWAP